MVAFKGLGPISRVALLAALHSLLSGCNAAICEKGTRDCPCDAEENCQEGLVCEESMCREDESDQGAKKPPKEGTGGTGSDSGAQGGRNEDPDDPGAGANDSGEGGTDGDEPPDPDDDAGAAGSGNASGRGGSGADDGGSAGAGATGGSSETGGSGGTDSSTGGSENSGGSGGNTSTGGMDAGGTNAGGTNVGGMNTGGMGGGVAGSAGSGGTGPVPFPAACWSCAVEGCFRETSACRADATCAACITTSYSLELCAANAEYADMAACFCSNFCAARCTDVCE